MAYWLRIAIGLALGTAVMVAGLVLGDVPVQSCVQLTAFPLVLVTAIGMTGLGVSRRQGMPRGQIVKRYSDALKGKPVPPELFRHVGRNFLNAGMVGAMVGSVQIVRNMQVPEKLGAGVAVAFISLLYGFLGYLAFGLGFEASVVADPAEDDAPLRLEMIGLRLGFVLLVLLEIVLAASLSGLGALQLIHAPSLVVLVAGPLVVAAFIRRVGKVHLPYLANGILASGAIGSIFNLIHSMEHLSDANNLYAGFSVAMLPMLYAALAWLLLRSIAEAAPLLEPVPQPGAMRALPLSLIPHFVSTAGVLLVLVVLVVYAVRLPHQPAPHPPRQSEPSSVQDAGVDAGRANSDGGSAPQQ